MEHFDVLKINSADITRAVELCDRVWWVGQYLADDLFQCNAYLIENGVNSALIDPGGHLTFEAVRKKVEEVVPFSHVRYFICSHQDPDITASLKSIDTLPGRNPEAVVVTHWRARELIKHYDLRMPFREIEEHGWQLDLGGRMLFFVLTPYLHFPGAFCTFDAATGTMFTSDVFGGMTRDWSLVARDESYFEDIRPFHEHYMPSREILLHGIMKMEEYPIRLIAPQHGSILQGDLVRFVSEKLKQLDCGIFALAADSTDIRRLSLINRTLKEITSTVVMYRDFRDIANALIEILKRTLPATSVEFYTADIEGSPLYFGPETRFRASAEAPPAEVAAVIGAGRDEWFFKRAASYVKLPLPARPAGLRGNAKDWCAVIPLFSQDGRARAAAVVRLAHDVEMTKDLNQMLERMGATFGIALEREVFYHMLDAERSRFYQQSIKDGLTGLYSRFYMEETLKRLMHAHDRNPRYSITAVMFDIDRFKSINDTFGHHAGDTAIKMAASVISGSIRASDIPVRYGGEEFAVFLMGSTAEGSVVVAEKIRAAVEAAELDGVLSGQRLTVSAGVAVRRQKETLIEFLRRADRAMYEAKTGGRNRVVYLEE